MSNTSAATPVDLAATTAQTQELLNEADLVKAKHLTSRKRLEISYAITVDAGSNLGGVEAQITKAMKPVAAEEKDYDLHKDYIRRLKDDQRDLNAEARAAKESFPSDVFHRYASNVLQLKVARENGKELRKAIDQHKKKFEEEIAATVAEKAERKNTLDEAKNKTGGYFEAYVDSFGDLVDFMTKFMALAQSNKVNYGFKTKLLATNMELTKSELEVVEWFAKMDSVASGDTMAKMNAKAAKLAIRPCLVDAIQLMLREEYDARVESQRSGEVDALLAPFGRLEFVPPRNLRLGAPAAHADGAPVAQGGGEFQAGETGVGGAREEVPTVANDEAVAAREAGELGAQDAGGLRAQEGRTPAVANGRAPEVQNEDNLCALVDEELKAWGDKEVESQDELKKGA